MVEWGGDFTHAGCWADYHCPPPPIQTNINASKRKTEAGTPVHREWPERHSVRFDDDVIKKIDGWAKTREIDRSEAIRRLVEIGLAGGV